MLNRFLRFVFSGLLIFATLESSNTTYACSIKKEAHIKDYALQGEDVTKVLQCLIDQYSTIVIDPGIWYISPGIKLRSNVTIKGENGETSILKRSEDKFKIESGVLFYTEKSNIYVFTQKNQENNFDEKKIKYSNIHFENLTIDFNRSPIMYSKEQMTEANLFGIIFSQCKNCSVDNCRLVDSMDEVINNGCSAVVFFQSKDCRLSGCYSEHITLVKSIYSNHVTVSNNHSESSVATCIEFICGDRGVISNNYINEVYWDVSCVGVNTTNCIVKDNIVKASPQNISCLTLGHRGYDYLSASGTVVYDNTFQSGGVRSIIIQNGSNIQIKNNQLSCVLYEDSKTPTFGCIVARGDDIANINIYENEMITTGDKIYGAIFYSGKGRIIIRGNKIISKRGIVINSNTDEIIIEKNEINSSEYSLCVNYPKTLRVTNNYLTDGFLIKGGMNIFIRDNAFHHTLNSSYIYDKWENISLIDNAFIHCWEVGHLFLINVKDKRSYVNLSRLHIKNNKIDNGPDYLVKFSGFDNSEQLRGIRFNEQ